MVHCKTLTFPSTPLIANNKQPPDTILENYVIYLESYIEPFIITTLESESTSSLCQTLGLTCEDKNCTFKNDIPRVPLKLIVKCLYHRITKYLLSI